MQSQELYFFLPEAVGECDGLVLCDVDGTSLTLGPVVGVTWPAGRQIQSSC